jgi:hypothetical protein
MGGWVRTARSAQTADPENAPQLAGSLVLVLGLSLAASLLWHAFFNKKYSADYASFIKQRREMKASGKLQ